MPFPKIKCTAVTAKSHPYNAWAIPLHPFLWHHQTT
jgi:hypothetical protein